MPITWKKGRGKLGLLQPLIGSWVANAPSEMGPVRCSRTFKAVLNSSYVQLTVRWEFGPISTNTKDKCRDNSKYAGRAYEEIALIGAGSDGTLHFWSFTSDGKQSHGSLVDVSDIHKDAFGFEAQMPAGLARMAYWPDQNDGYRWAVEAKHAKGWRRVTEHHYLRA